MYKNLVLNSSRKALQKPSSSEDKFIQTELITKLRKEHVKCLRSLNQFLFPIKNFFPNEKRTYKNLQ